VATLRTVAGQFADGSLSDDALRALPDEEILDRPGAHQRRPGSRRYRLADAGDAGISSWRHPPIS
jgi:hypothetical protein